MDDLLDQMSTQEVFEPEGLLGGSQMQQLFDPVLTPPQLLPPLNTLIPVNQDGGGVMLEELGPTPQHEEEPVPETETPSIAVSRPGRNRRAPKIFSPEKDVPTPQKSKATSSSKSNSIKQSLATDDATEQEDEDESEEDTNLYCTCQKRDDGR
jgi:hypothetical protein